MNECSVQIDLPPKTGLLRMIGFCWYNNNQADPKNEEKALQ